MSFFRKNAFLCSPPSTRPSIPFLSSHSEYTRRLIMDEATAAETAAFVAAPRAEMTERTADVGEARAHEAAEVDGANNNETSRGDAGRTAQMPHDGASEDGSHDARASLRQRRSMKALSKRTAVHLQAGEVEVPCEVQHHDLQLVQVGKPEAREREGEPSRGAEAEDFHSPPETRPFWESWFR